MEQNRGPGYESTQLCPPYFLIKVPKTYDEEKPLQQMLLGKSGYLPAEN
jgi:hypothetical protein